LRSGSYLKILVLQGLAWEECLAYLESDDVIILGHNFQDHTQKLENVFEKFKTYNLKLKPAKCKLVLWGSRGSISICQYPAAMSTFDMYVVPFRVSKQDSILGSGKASLVVIS
jgi:hypothetical protein